MSLILEGTLEDIRLCDLLRLVSRETRSGVLRVTIDGVGHELRLQAGSVTGVRVGEDGEPAELEPTVMTLVRHRRGTFRLAPAEDDDPESSAQGIQAETLAGQGDMALLGLEEHLDAVGGEGAVPARGDFPTPRQMEDMTGAQRTVYGLVDGERDLGELILRSRLDPARVLAELEYLEGESLVHLERSSPAAPAARPTGGRAWASGLSGVVGSLLPLLLLVGGIGLVATTRPEPAPTPFEIRDDPLAAAHAAQQAASLRAAIEAHRFLEGRWPERLATLAERGYVSEGALTDARGHSYYYAVRDEGFVLLAPER